ncbi:hypothetical protein L208DRAFT_1297930 [Tricholoma matsutake]|nr:hypothetical protein L208DRAFT_1297930 [Tricholoma matsutake 945]
MYQKEMKQMAARNFEDLLQNMIPAVEGLLPEPHNSKLMTLLFRLAEWHMIAKLRMHTDFTLTLLTQSTMTIGKELCLFAEWTLVKLTSVAASSAANPPFRQESESQLPKTKPPVQRVRKVFNLFTYKLHALGDYVQTICLFGTTDSYSTQIGELSHCLVKCFYHRTNKKDATQQIAKHERCHTRLRHAKEAAASPRRHHPHHIAFFENDPLPFSGVDLHHHLSDSKNFPHHLLSFVHEPRNDPAKKNFIPRLKDHLLSRVLHREFDGDEAQYTSQDRSTIRIIGDQIYSAKVLRVNYTTYDIRRDQDSMNPHTHCDIMVHSTETGPDAHKYWYARVLGVFHAKVMHSGPEAQNRSIQHMEFLWVQWFGMEPNYHWGFKTARLPKVGFVPDTDDATFGFLDPSLVIRGCHLIPCFASGRMPDLLSTSSLTAARQPDEVDDWANYYVMIFVDRDMFM